MTNYCLSWGDLDKGTHWTYMPQTPYEKTDCGLPVLPTVDCCGLT